MAALRSAKPLRARRAQTAPAGFATLRLMAALSLAGVLSTAIAMSMAHAQAPPTAPPATPAAGARADAPPSPEAQTVIDVRIVGNEFVKPQDLQQYIRTRRGRPLDVELIEEDVQRLNSSRRFVDIKVLYQQVTGGVAVIFQVVERPSIREIHFIGNDFARIKPLKKQLDLKIGGPIDPYAVEDGRRKLEEFYRERGFTQVRIDVAEGDKVGDRRVVYVIHEGPKQKIGSVEFVGNTIASDARLKTQIESKTPILHVPYLIEGFKGFYDEEKIAADEEKLTAYYRSLGFFQAEIGSEPIFDANQKWATLRFVINEGPRYKVRSVSFLGNKQFATETLREKTKLGEGEYFDQLQMDADLAAVRDEYGAIGHVFADIQAEPRFREEPGELDLVYTVAEGARARVGRVIVEISGDHPHTKQNTVLNQLSFAPGDILDIRQVRASERRLMRSGIFGTNPAQGQTPPTITFAPPGADTEESIADRPRRGRVRGQSPDPSRPPTLDYRMLRPLAAPTSGVDQLPPHLQPARPAPAPPAAEPPRLPPPGRFDPRAYPAPAPSTPPLMRRSAGPVIRGQSPDMPGAHRWGEPRPAASDASQPWRASVPSSQRYAARPNLAATAQQPVVRAQYTAPSPFGNNLPPLTPQRQPAASATVPGQLPNAYTQGQPAYGAPTNSYPPSTVYQQPASPPPPGYYQQPGGPPPAGYYQQPPVYGSPPPATAGQALPPGAYGDGPPEYLQFGTPRPGAPAAAPSGPSAPGVLPSPGGYDSPGELYPENSFLTDEPVEPPVFDTDVIVRAEETQTGRLMFGVGINSNAGLVGSVILDEQNFDWRRFPRSWEDIRNATAWRGAGQQLRIEAVPGNQLQRYAITFREPYLADTPVSFRLSGFFFTRRYFEWDEQRIGGNTGLGYQFTPDLSGTITIGGQQVNISNPATPTPAELAEVVGDNELWTAEASLVHDTRDHAFLPTEGHRIQLTYEQGFGQFDYPRGIVEVSQYFMIHERPDRSGRQVLMVRSLAGFSGSDTPIFENFFAGGFSTLRGFDFRGASPRELGIVVGGEFEWLNTVEYMFPITADDMLRGVFFCDFGTVEQDITLNGDNFRVAPGFGLRINVAAMGPAPIALDFAVPVAHAPGDDIQNFSFFVGFAR